MHYLNLILFFLVFIQGFIATLGNHHLIGASQSYEVGVIKKGSELAPADSPNEVPKRQGEKKEENRSKMATSFIIQTLHKQDGENINNCL